MSLRDATGDRVGTLRIQSSIDDRAVRRTCRAAVAAATMPRRSSQILVLRSVAVDVVAGDNTTQFRSELQDRVADGWSRARRPTQDAVGDADAVVFRDHVELLVHYLVDLARGRAAHHWWWATLADLVAPRGAAPADVLIAHASEAPAVIVELDRIGRLAVVLPELDASAARRVLIAVAEAYALPMHVAPSDHSTSDRDLAAIRGDPVVAGLTGKGIGTPRAVLVGLARLLVTDLAAARTPLVIEQVTAAISGVGATDSENASGNVLDGQPERRGATPVARAERPLPGLDGSSLHPDDMASGEPDPTRARSAESVARPDQRAADRDVSDVRAISAPVAGQEISGRSDAANHIDTGADPLDHPVASRHGADAVDRDTPFEPLAEVTALSAGSIRTEFGGVFFLIAPLIELGISESGGRRVETEIGWWGILELLARSLVRIGPRVERDPIWGELALLNGGRSAIDRARALRPNDLQPNDRWAADAEPPPEMVPMANTAASTLGGAASAWLEQVRGPVAAHLCGRLGVAAGDLEALLLHRTAALAIDRTHVEVFFPLDAAHLAVRRAGFDRDPGWVPELGRVVLFHFGKHDAERAVAT